MANYCAIHSGEHNNTKRSKLEQIMTELPENQSGRGRHKCPYCAYERGLRDGYRKAIQVLKSNE